MKKGPVDHVTRSVGWKGPVVSLRSGCGRRRRGFAAHIDYNSRHAMCLVISGTGSLPRLEHPLYCSLEIVVACSNNVFGCLH